jgi:hypothetical protein
LSAAAAAAAVACLSVAAMIFDHVNAALTCLLSVLLLMCADRDGKMRGPRIDDVDEEGDEDGGAPGDGGVDGAVPERVKRERVKKATRTRAPPAASAAYAGECM